MAESWTARNRPRITWAFAIAVLVQICAFGLSLAGPSWYSGRVPRPLDLSVQAELLLATGTLALAYAALLQVDTLLRAWSDDASWRDQQHKDRAKDREPNLTFGIRKVPKPRLQLPANPFVAAQASPSLPFMQSELYIENVGPGIAGNLSATLLRLYVDYDPRLQDDPEVPDPFSETLDPEGLINADHRFRFRKLGLSSPYLGVGPENRMSLLNGDEWEIWSGANDMEMDRMYIVFIEFSDLEGELRKKVAGGIAWASKVPGFHGEPTDIEEEVFRDESRWYLARSDQIEKVTADWEARAKSAGKFPPVPAEW